MTKIQVFTDKKSNNYDLFSGMSSSGRICNHGIERIAAKNRDELISTALLRADLDSYVLSAYGPLLTGMKSSEIYDAIEFAIDKIDFDILFLTIYSDNCPLRTDERSYENMVFTRTVSPHGTECILISPKGVDRLLEIIKDDCGRGYDFYINAAAEKMSIYTSYPPMMMVDVSKRSDDMKLIKSTVCREVISAQKPITLTKKYTGNMNLFWFFLIVIFILFIAAMMLSFDGSRNYKVASNANEKRDVVPMGKQKAAELLSPYNQ